MLIVSIIITLILTGIAGYIGKLKVKTAKDFINADNKLGILGVTSMLMGSIIGGASTVGTAQMAYKHGISAIWFILGVCIASILLGLLYSSQVGKANMTTLPQIIGNTYGIKARTSSSLLLSLGMFIHISGQVLACTPLFTSIFNLDVKITSIIVIFLLVCYIVFGGFWGSTMVGAVKTVLLYGTSIICGIILIFSLNGTAEILNHFPKNPWFNIFSDGIFEDLASGFSTVLGILSTQTYFQSIMAGKSPKTSKISSFLVAFLIFPVGIVCTLIGMYMRIHFPNINPNEAFPLFLINYLHPALGGVSIATVLISSIATGAGLALGIATMMVKDIIPTLSNKKLEDKREILYLRICILIIGILTLVIVTNNTDSMILNWGFLSMIFRATPIFVPVLCALFFKNKINKKAGFHCVLAGPLSSILWIIIGFSGITSIYIGITMNILAMTYASKRFNSVKRI
ncbi:sodium:solute symporter family protein [Clostridium sporogenes]|uniref:Sodium:solute symporter family protein n=1 Tax=Clostridium botulinum TaxID=1491 RepID=A0A6M0T362_CLOBO|nr:sodium:solute symporter family protein [Clostridium sporogenes]NFA62256.1 sodium:solute symporter family protein [Clostridium botulinum]NFI75093.1 sodium:solute symporter family protein [Clostridium sporogenes]NFL72029.1 sodium:solute symporter family protein [Clostridium sporogenes]NFM25061.1 sodium:solute symporter family protein [Clostridium sporogenes]NFP63286.1 sodium:solute symporter family protein [Clostridium sporogenes]